VTASRFASDRVAKPCQNGLMAGHSKWKNIRLRKGKQDAIRSSQYTKLSREIIVAAREGGSDPGSNARLRIAVAKARSVGMPSENIERAIKRGSGELEGENYEAVTYEGYGPGGVAVIVECFTENRNRTVADLRHVFAKYGGNLASNGSVIWRFKQVGVIVVPRDGLVEDEFALQAIDAGAEDFGSDEEEFTLYTTPESLHSVSDALDRSGYKPTQVEMSYVPVDKASLSPDDAAKVMKLLDALDDLDDVKETYVNAELEEELAERS
jgi:YebC/PmpR family DNA-binding regulatory protein